MAVLSHLGTGGAGHQGLAHVTDSEDGWCLHVVPVLLQEGVSAVINNSMQREELPSGLGCEKSEAARGCMRAGRGWPDLHLFLSSLLSLGQTLVLACERSVQGVVSDMLLKSQTS